MPTTRVLWVIKGLGPGGAERLLVEAARSVDRERFDYEAAYLLPWKDQLVPELRAADLPVHCLDVTQPADPRWIRTLRRRIVEGRFDVVHAHLPTSGVGARIATRSIGRDRPAMIYTEHNMWDRYRRETRHANARTYAWNDRGIAVSASVAASMSSSAQRRTVVVPNGIDLAGLAASAIDRVAARTALGITGDGPVIGTVGGITPKKGHLDLVRAASQVVEHLPSARFAFVGLEVDPAPVIEAIAAAGLQDTILLSGYHANAATLMRAFDVYCLPSLHEGMPLSLIEAMSLGLPVVATRVGGTPEVVTHDVDGILVDPGAPDALALALRSLLEGPDRAEALGRRAAETALRFDIRAMVHAVEEIYLETLGERRR